MPTQKTLKRRVRARRAKTGEAYTTARMQLLRKAPEPEPATDDPTPVAPVRDPEPEAFDPALLPMSDEAMRRGTGRGYHEWFALLDAWGATERGHTATARWVAQTYEISGWWAQGVTNAYERVRGGRGVHEMPDGYRISSNRTVAVPAERLIAAFDDPAVRERWLPGVAVVRRPTRAANSARFDWPDPPSRLIVLVTPKGPDRSSVSIQHEQLRDAEIGQRMKAAWKEHLTRLKAVLEAG